MHTKKFLAALACLLLLGAGCGSGPDSKPVAVTAAAKPEVGQTINGWKVEKVNGVDGPVATVDNYAALLKGPVELSGAYRYYNDASYEGWIMTFTPSEQDADKSPTGRNFIIMANTEAAVSALELPHQTEASGSAAFVLDDLVFGKRSAVSPPGGATATFVKLGASSR